MHGGSPTTARAARPPRSHPDRRRTAGPDRRATPRDRPEAGAGRARRRRPSGPRGAAAAAAPRVSARPRVHQRTVLRHRGPVHRRPPPSAARRGPAILGRRDRTPRRPRRTPCGLPRPRRRRVVGHALAAPFVVRPVMLRPAPTAARARPTMIPEPPISRSPASRRAPAGAPPGEEPDRPPRTAATAGPGRDLHAFIAGLPKAELHVHHVGSASPRIVSELAAPATPTPGPPPTRRPWSTTSPSRTSPTSSTYTCPSST
ncbi:hypothetical protein SALBM217S_01488 [Streptomyces griseoloalbus]